MMASLLRWCLSGLLLAALATAASTRETSEKPYILDEETSEKPYILDEKDLPENYIKFGSDEFFKLVEGEFDRFNPNHINGEELFEGDILLTPEQRRMLVERKGTPYSYRLWTTGSDGNPSVPYVFSDINVDQAAVQNAINHWEQHTCIRFSGMSTSNTDPHLQFFKGSGCWSYVGMLTQPGQQVSIGSGCTGLGTVVHEIGHAIGFNHEQSRSDRDDYVIINIDNIRTGKEGNFEKRADNNHSVPYDYTSNMHYSGWGFSNNGKLTIATINPRAQGLIGQRDGLSHYDKLLANTMYRCIVKWEQNCNLASNPCQNHGYVGSDCACVCRKGTSGNFCETVDQGYYDSFLSGCSENITAPGTVTSPNYPNNYDADKTCVKWIQAPECYTVSVTFNAFKLYGKNPYCGTSVDCCYFDVLEIRTSDMYNGDIFCDSDIATGRTFTSTGNQLILHFKTRTNYFTGWTADVVFTPVSGCATTTTTTPTTTTSTTTTTTPTTTTTTPTTTTTTTTPTTTTTTTTPTTTTTTTTPTTTTTTPTTTTTTTTPTTTTTTPTTTTTTTTPTTTTTGTTATPDCNEEFVSTTTSHWTSPLFGQSNYPNDAFCLLSRSSPAPSWARITFNTFALESDDTCAYDNVSFSQPFDFDDQVLCGSQSGEIKLPSFNFDAWFESDDSVTDIGFNITITQETSKCHKLITPGSLGDTGVIKPPRKANNVWAKKGCEWWFEAPAGMKIKLEFHKMKLAKSSKKNSVIVNRSGDPTYPVSESKSYSGKKLPNPRTITSDGNKMNVLFFSTRAKKMFKARWTVVA